jgi:hypothetical protein
MSKSETRKWAHIGGLHNVVRDARKYHESGGPPPPVVMYKAKVKLHGTNAAVRIEKGKPPAFQSRSNDVVVGDDNAGFALWASRQEWPDKPFLDEEPVMVIHGEWAGLGIQKGTACNQLEGKHFFIFALEFCSHEVNEESGDWARRKLITDPSDLRLAATAFFPSAIVIPWHSDEEYTVDLGDEGMLRDFSERINALVAEVEACDPFIRDTFNVEGTGEGVVMYPVGMDDREGWRRIAFKAKGEKHRVKASKVAAEVAPEVLASTEAFVAAFVTEARCEQGLGVVCPDGIDIKKTGGFIGWVSKDVKRESETELEAAGLTWKQVGKAVSTASREWFMGRYRAF